MLTMEQLRLLSPAPVEDGGEVVRMKSTVNITFPPGQVPNHLLWFSRILDHMGESWSALTLPEKNRFLRTIIDHVVVHEPKGRLDIVYRDFTLRLSVPLELGGWAKRLGNGVGFRGLGHHDGSAVEPDVAAQDGQEVSAEIHRELLPQTFADQEF
ncbi:hypothetical protein [Geothrix sp. 21YS21S-2]|uniref:hypothetical protein n=1 Tax=Geothrix sp. 21YS21S-2 TaxID=3068893 RepID=UPI0027B8DDAE|nr:hypothetical protein [Geothrix sp. 21YS21S-2]